MLLSEAYAIGSDPINTKPALFIFVLACINELAIKIIIPKEINIIPIYGSLS